MWASENQSDVEAELKLEEPMEMGGDVSTSEDDGHMGVITTSVEHHAPVAASINGGWDTERRGDVLVSRKHAVSSDGAVERDVKRARSSRPSKASLALPPCSEHGEACWPFGGACLYPRIFGVCVCM